MKPNDRARERSKTPGGFAKAFYEANKWMNEYLWRYADLY
jgi:hypothetical protein